MLPKIFYRGRFKKLCAIYGARIELWPDHEQSSAHAYMKRCPQKAASDIKAALRLDEVIRGLAPAMVSEESQWQALGQLAPNTGLGPVTSEVFNTFSSQAETAPDEVVPLVFPEPKPAATAAGQSEASMEIREERARMIARNSKNKKLFGKGVLKFQ